MLAVVVATVFTFGATAAGGPRTDAERVEALSAEIGCPVCQGESVAQSNAPAAGNIRREIARSVDGGQTDDEVRNYLARQYGEEQLLRPRGDGLSALVWIVPVVAVVLAGAGLVAVFRRWAAEAAGDASAPSEADRALVARFLEAESADSADGADGADDAERSGVPGDRPR